MGKLKRARQKYHLSRAKAAENTCTDTPESFQTDASNSTLLNSLPENIFSGIEISFKDLKQELPENDAVSVASSRHDALKKPISKKEKIKLRHEMFMKKLEVVNQLRKEAKQKRKTKTKAPVVTNDPKPVYDSLPSLEKLSRNKQPISKVKKSVPKMKTLQKNMLQDISMFKKILTDPQYKADPTSTITTHIQEKILQGAL